MPSPDTPAATASASKLLPRLGWFVILAALAYFVASNVPRYFIITPESYGSYFWPRVGWLFPHVVGGVIAAIIGPLQFWPVMRQKYLGFHRVAGRVYVACVAGGAIAGFGMIFKLGPEDAAYATGLAGLATAWLVTTSMAFVAIRRKHLTQHRQWMVRSYVVTFAFVSFRLVEKVMIAGQILNEHERAGVLAWGCWAVPLLVTEVVLQGAVLFKAKD